MASTGGWLFGWMGGGLESCLRCSLWLGVVVVCGAAMCQHGVASV